MASRLHPALKLAGLMAIVLIAVKVAGLRVDAPESISPHRVGIVPFETDATQHAQNFAREIGARAATRLNTIDSVTSVVIATRPAGFGDPAVNRQIRFNYQVGTMLSGRVSAVGHRLDIVVTLIDTGRDRIVWQRTFQSEETLETVISRVVEEIASAVVAEL